MVRPSPFCLLDEIDAALDESNVGRFADMLIEFSKRSQFIIITHNKKTVAYADTLLGVTMEESGVSKVIAIRMSDRETVNA
jgi:chromosome segregation protein